ncbi:MAG: efflux RND transporter periplasmic adaptor subunit [Gammaproteobacteria bacterium]|nr:efflux RND transporter periplasmic adaptor subunit [Gammaproteobacteria bacterium]
MKIRNPLFYLLIVVVITLSACSDDKNAAKQSTANTESALEHAEKHTDPKYVCPMHPQIVRDKPGSCPICGMTLVQKEAEQSSDASGEAKILYYRHPHKPEITSDKPMKDEMGMDYVPIYDDGGGSAVKISPAVENNMGVRTAYVERSKLWRKIDTVGYVDFDENKISHIHIRSNGWIEKLVVQSEGERVKKGQLLFELYSPELVNAQDDYIQALRSGSPFLLNASRERLEALGISKKQIATIKKRRKTSQYVQVYAPQDGIVAKLKVREGMYITPNMEVMSLADLSSIWILAEVFESQANWVKAGQTADVKLSYVPGREWEGKVEYIYPSLNQQTRTLKVRLVFDNPDEVLKPNMFANVSIYGGAKKEVLIIPREALIRAGREERVILSVGKGRFKPRQVVVGIESGDWIEIRNGLMEGDKVVTSGQFLIDSEASLKASLKRMQSPTATEPKPKAKAVDHSQHQMGGDEAMQAKVPAQEQMKDEKAMQSKDHSQQQMIENKGMQGMDHSQQQMESRKQMKAVDTNQDKMEPAPTPIDIDQHEQQAMEKRLSGSGTIREILASEGKVKLSHGPIPELKWPEMTMFFRVNPAVSLDSFKPEDKVEFDLQRSDTGYVIRAMRKLTK